MTVVLANGVFDVLHLGHVQHLREARAMGDRLIVSLTVDAYVNKGPGRPLYPWAARAAVLAELRCVDEVVPTNSAIEAIMYIKPDIFVKGIDYADRDGWSEDVEAACAVAGAELRFTRSAKQSVTDIIRNTMAIYE
jgi:rfaE bifunctional protein nucleotidyltransferase chain/domain